MASGTHIDKILVMDCETSGLNWNGGKSAQKHDVSYGYQPVSWGMIITDTETYEPIDELYVEIKWNGEAKWDERAERIHGLSKEYLEEHGMEEEEALVEIIEFIMKHMDIKKPIYTMGHNVASFDLLVLKDMLKRYELSGLKFGFRHFDTFSLSMGTVKEHDSTKLFKKLGLPPRSTHNALEDARYSLEVYRRINKVWNKLLKTK